MKPSQKSLDEAEAWDYISSMMDQKIVFVPVREIRRGTDIINDMVKAKDLLREKVDQISASIDAKIEIERKSLHNESNQLAGQISAVQALEDEVNKEIKLASDIVDKKRATEQNILQYKSEAVEEVGEIDDIELNHLKRLAMVRRKISMYAEMTNIKWDYSCAGTLAGEVSLPHKFIHRRFSIDKDDPEFEVAEKLWNVIEG